MLEPMERSVWTGWDATRELFFRVAASGVVPAKLFLPSVPETGTLVARTGQLKLEIVSHCWNYAHLLAYQLSALVNYPPTKLSVTMTVFYTPEDSRTAALLGFFGGIEVPGVTWNWQALEKSHLLRRAIGRNRAALASPADWVWFTDCDMVFHRGCLDTLAERLQGRRDALVHPVEEHCTSLLSGDDPMLTAATGAPGVVEIDLTRFTPQPCEIAKGGMQITHGDVARAAGYCDSISVYQKPVESWHKAHEDRAFRWLLRTGGVGIEFPGVFRIRHAAKGRYDDKPLTGAIRQTIRRGESWIRERWRARERSRL
jgi:hypothetical protein